MIGLGSRRRPGLGGGLGGGLRSNAMAGFSSGSRVVTARETADSVISALTPAAWYRNATGVTEAGGFASQWDDYSGNARHLVQATGTNQPAYNSTGGVFTFDGADNFMKVTGGFTLNQAWTLVIVGSQKAWTNIDMLCDGNAINTGQIRQDTTTPALTITTNGTTVASNTNLALNTRGILCAVFNGASSSLRVNDTAKTTGNAGAGNAGGFTLGCGGNGLQGWANMTAEEVFIIPSALSDANQDAVITALNNALTVF